MDKTTIKNMTRGAYDIQKLRIQMGNRVVSNFKVKLGIKPGAKEDSRVWCNPIFYWSEKRCKEYIKAHDSPKNPVKERLCISGECLCGAFAGKEELEEIRFYYPEVADRIDRLSAIAKKNGYPWPWSMGPSLWNKAHPEGVGELGFMCVGCENKMISDE